MGAMTGYCRDPSESNLLAIVKQGLDVDARTCVVSVSLRANIGL